jgi:hypothetical protein
MVSEKTRRPKLLIAVGSAGINPWLAIEKKAQMPIIRAAMSGLAEVVWIEGDPNISSKLRYRVLNWLLLKQMGVMYSRRIWVRNFFKKTWNRWEWVTFGASYLTWMARNRQTQPGAESEGPRVTQDLPIQMALAGSRTINALQYVLDTYDFDYLLRITSTCLPVPGELRRLLGRLPPLRVYGGELMKFAGTNFVSGAAVLLSRDVVEGVCENAGSYSYGVYEDVALGRLIQSEDLADLIAIPRVDVTSVHQVPRDAQPAWPGATVVRCKAQHPTTTESEPVIDIMRKVSRHLI